MSSGVRDAPDHTADERRKAGRIVRMGCLRFGRITIDAGKLFVGTLASRVLGFVRMFLMARYFGGGTAMDVFNIAFMIPNLFRRVLGEDAIESSFLPTFRSLVAQGRVGEAWRAAAVVLNWLFLMLVVAAGLCTLFAPQLVSWVLAPGFPPNMAADAAFLGRVMSPFLVFVGLAAFCGALLLAHGQVLTYSLAPTLFNVGWIGVMMLGHRRLGMQSLAVGVLVGGLLELAVTALGVWRRRRQTRATRWDLRAGFRDEHCSDVLRLAGPVIAAAIVARMETVVDRTVASFLPEGSVAALGYAMPLVLLPFALFGLSIGRAALTPMSEDAALNDVAAFRRSVREMVRLGLVILVPLSALTALAAHPLAQLLQTGKFGPEETRMTAVALRYYALGLAPMGIVSILSRALHATKDTKSPFAAARWSLYANVLLSAMLALTPMRHGGVALATSLSLVLQAALLFAALRANLSRHDRDGRWTR